MNTTPYVCLGGYDFVYLFFSFIHLFSQNTLSFESIASRVKSLVLQHSDCAVWGRGTRLNLRKVLPSGALIFLNVLLFRIQFKTHMPNTLYNANVICKLFKCPFFEMQFCFLSTASILMLEQIKTPNCK